MRRSTFAFAATVVALGFGCGAALADGTPVWSWLLGPDLNSGTIGQLAGATDVYVGNYYGGSTTADFSGNRFVRSATDGFFEFEHSAAVANNMLLPEASDGTPTPMAIGMADGQDVTPLIVSGASAITGDLQSWQLGAASPSGIDAQGALRLNAIVLEPKVSNGRIELEAVLPDGSAQVLIPTPQR